MTEQYPPEYWVNRAAEAERIAELLNDPECKRVMYTIAAGYVRIARTVAGYARLSKVSAELHTQDQPIRTSFLRSAREH